MVRYNKTINQKLHKEFCEVCDNTDVETLHHHHIVPRSEIGTSNNPFNISVLCANCHNKVHANIIEIVGVYPSTNRHGRQLIYITNGTPNIEGITEPYFKHKAKQTRLDFDKKTDRTK